MPCRLGLSIGRHPNADPVSGHTFGPRTIKQLSCPNKIGNIIQILGLIPFFVHMQSKCMLKKVHASGRNRCAGLTTLTDNGAVTSNEYFGLLRVFAQLPVLMESGRE